MSVRVVGLVCPQCGTPFEDCYVSYARVTVDLEELPRFTVEGPIKHRCIPRIHPTGTEDPSHDQRPVS